MGKHNAPAEHIKISRTVKVITHYGVHCFVVIALHVVALLVIGVMKPVLMIIGTEVH